MEQDVPGRVFLDTCVVNFTLEYGEQIHDNLTLPPGVNDRAAEDIYALRQIFLTGQRAGWQIAVSPFTYSEIAATQDMKKLSQLDFWFQELWQYWRSVVDSEDRLPSFMEAEEIRVRTLTSGYLNVLPDVADRVLLCDALVYQSDLFCTRDWTTILKHRDYLTGLPIKIVTPSEWWESVQKYAGLFL